MTGAVVSHPRAVPLRAGRVYNPSGAAAILGAASPPRPRCYNHRPMSPAEEAPGTLFSRVVFDDLDLADPLRRAVAELGFVHLTQVQAEVLPLSLAGRDVVAQAQTGSGKTAAYLLTIFSRLLAHPRTSPPEVPRALIVAPTRELAVQISGDAAELGRHCDLRIHVVFGGLDYRKQRDVLAAGTDLLIGTPGRLIDYHQQNAYSLRSTEVVVIDECDRLFDMGFAEDLRWILRRLPPPKQRQSLMFTATLSSRVMALGWRQMNDPTEIVIHPEQLTPETIRQELYHVASREKMSLLLGLLEREGGTRTMIFVNTRHGARRLVEDLHRHGYTARALTGNVMQTKRLRVLDDFRDGSLPILVATDVASRGLHIEGVSHVINYDLPQDAEDYVHRIGRTARVGAKGTAISLACEDYVYSLDAIHTYIGYQIPVAFADDSLYHDLAAPEPRRSARPRGARPAAKPYERNEAAAPVPSTEGQPARRRRRRSKRGGRRPGSNGGGAPESS
jgi:ATP-dependent RNA helicase RhlB